MYMLVYKALNRVNKYHKIAFENKTGYFFFIFSLLIKIFVPSKIMFSHTSMLRCTRESLPYTTELKVW